MKVVQINVSCEIGSTGEICTSVSKALTENGIENYILYSQWNSEYPLGKRYAKSIETKFQALTTRLFGNFGFNSRLITLRLISMIENINPDIVQLHNIHSYNCNLSMLFKYLKKKKIKTVWTFHDCWPFTGYCTHFSMVGCEKWKTKCGNCPQRKTFSWFFDNSTKLHHRKMKSLSGLDLTIVTPSKWLADLVKQSFLSNYPITVINNGVNINTFKPTESTFREKYNCGSRHIILGVAFEWSIKKGLDVFLKLYDKLDSEKYQVVLVGTTAELDKRLPNGIISIHRTKDTTELAKIYTAADVFINPTREEVLGLVNIEANACGTPVVTFNAGGSPECVDEKSGGVVEINDVEGLYNHIIDACEKRPYSSSDCIARARLFDSKAKYQEYVNLYKKISGIV